MKTFTDYPTMTKLLLLIATLLLGLAMAAGLNYYQNISTSSNITWLEQRGCDLSQDNCTYKTQPSQKSITVFLSDSSLVKAMSPLIINVVWPNLNVDTLALSLTGSDMYMGEVRFSLKKQASGEYQSQIYLPICTTGAMTWLGEIVAVREGGSMTVDNVEGLKFQLTTTQ